MLLLLVIFITNPTYADTKNIQVNVGGVKIDVQAPTKFYEISKISPETRKIVEGFVPPTNRLLAIFVSEEDLEKVTKGELPELNRYMLLQTYRKLETKNISTKQFQIVIKQIKEQQDTVFNKEKDKIDKLVDNAAEQISNEYDTSMEIKIGEIVPLGVFYEHPNAIGIAILSKVQVADEEEKLNYAITGAFSTILANGKILYAYTYSTYKNKEDINWVKSKSKEWANSIISPNSTLTTEKSHSNFSD